MSEGGGGHNWDEPRGNREVGAEEAEEEGGKRSTRRGRGQSDWGIRVEGSAAS